MSKAVGQWCEGGIRISGQTVVGNRCKIKQDFIIELSKLCESNNEILIATSFHVLNACDRPMTLCKRCKLINEIAFLTTSCCFGT